MDFVCNAVFLTRKCTLDCEYCKIKDNNFPNELTVEQWKRALQLMTDLGTGISILLGGEPLCMKEDLVELVRWMGNNEIPYALITNSVTMGKWRKKLVDAGLMNWSPSIDTLGKSNLGHSIKLKSRKTLEHLEFFKKVGVPDLVTQITATNQNLEEIPEIIQYFTEQEIWSEVMILNHSKGPLYDYCATREEMPALVFNPGDELRIMKVEDKIKDMIQDGALVHNHTNFFNKWHMYAIKNDYFCHSPAVPTIDSDGKLRSCVYFKGKLVNDVSVFDLEDEEGQEQYLRLWKKDWSSRCKGCAWDCMMGAEKYLKENATAVGKDWFAHKLEATDRRHQQ